MELGEIIVGVLVPLSTIAGIVLSYVLTKRKELKLKEREEKIEVYNNFLDAIFDDSKVDIQPRSNIIFLVGSLEVVNKTNELLTYFMKPKNEILNFTEETNRLIRELYILMRKDIYNNKKESNEFPKELHLFRYDSLRPKDRQIK